jgi:Predicted membrane protein
MKKCTKCGAKMPDNATICTKCETPFASSKASRSSGEAQPETRLAEVKQPENTQTVVYQPIYIQQAPQAEPDGKGKAVTSLVLGLFGLTIGIVGIPFSYGLLSVLALIPSLLGLVLAVMARNRIPVGASGRSIATAGLACSILATIICGLVTAVYALCIYGLVSLCASTPVEQVDYYTILLSLSNLIR